MHYGFHRGYFLLMYTLLYRCLEFLIRYPVSISFNSIDALIVQFFFFYALMASLPLLVVYVSRDLSMSLSQKVLSGLLIFLTGVLFMSINIIFINFYATPEVSSDNFKKYPFERIHLNLYLFSGLLAGTLLCKFLVKRQLKRNAS